MKTFNWSAFSYVTESEFTAVISWIARMPLCQIANDDLDDAAPIQSNKLRFAIGLLENFDLVSKSQSHFALTELGKTFASADESARRAFLGIKMMDLIPVSEIFHLLERSVGGRLSRRVVTEFFHEAYGPRVAETDIEGFVRWAVACRLFAFDRKRHEIVWIRNETSPTSVQNGRAS